MEPGSHYTFFVFQRKVAGKNSLKNVHFGSDWRAQQKRSSPLVDVMRLKKSPLWLFADDGQAESNRDGIIGLQSFASSSGAPQYTDVRKR